jgi:salicylate hydroxylase
MAKRRGTIAIAGAGIGGLCSGVFLSRLGFEVAIYDQASRFGRVGAGIQQTPNATRCRAGAKAVSPCSATPVTQ